jgi:2-oxoisovalerate dehydrogenase E1 component alpha subunit
LKAFSGAEKVKKPSLDELFTDVYDVKPKHLEEQEAEMKRLVKKYPEHFSTAAHRE